MKNKKFCKNIIAYNMLNEHDTVVVGCSGGADSMFLLHNLFELKEKFKLEIKVCHLNHGIRETAKRDQDFVRDICEKLNLEFHTKTVNMDEFAKENAMSSEEAGRYLRYEFFREVGGKIFVAHNRDDQAETVLYRIIRGTGIDGLRAMAFVSKDVYRPMLDISRREIESYLFENGISHVEDETNSMSIYARNKIRLELIPYIEENLNPNFKDSLIRLQEIASAQSVYFSTLVSNYLRENLKDGILNIEKLKTEDDYFISLVMRDYLKTFNLTDGMGKFQFDSIVESVKNKRGAFMAHDRVFEISHNFISPRNEFKEVEEVLKFGINNTFFGKIIVEDGIKKGKNYIQIEKSKIKGNLKVRNRRSSDKFSPLGMKGTKKLKDFFIDSKIPRHMRDSVPIITDDIGIIWVVPYRMDENYRALTEDVISIGLEV